LRRQMPETLVNWGFQKAFARIDFLCVLQRYWGKYLPCTKSPESPIQKSFMGCANHPDVWVPQKSLKHRLGGLLLARRWWQQPLQQ